MHPGARQARSLSGRESSRSKNNFAVGGGREQGKTTEERNRNSGVIFTHVPLLRPQFFYVSHEKEMNLFLSLYVSTLASIGLFFTLSSGVFYGRAVTQGGSRNTRP